MGEGQYGRLILLDFITAVLCHATLCMKINPFSGLIKYELNKCR